MRPSECEREADVLDALQTSAWPDCCGEHLRAHVRGCRSCGELVEVVLPLLQEHRAATIEARVPSSAIVWWRLQMRARQEAAKAAMRPIAVIQGLALACAAGLLVAAVGFVSPEFRQFAAWLAGLGEGVAAAGLPAVQWPGLQLLSPLGVAVGLVVTLLIVVTPVAIYFAVSDE